ncbi:MAG TPA: polysaccharide deacetylase family protein [Kofleriaceae bacterium]|nr:polysaccharide deacetylase family protein [Kofleriaceae bacterium]
MTRSLPIAVVLTGALLAGCHDEHYLTYPWDDRRVLCSTSIDDLTEDAPWDLVEDQMRVAERTDAVLLLHAHNPGVGISTAAINRVLIMAEQHHLAFLTFRELDPSATPRAGLALAFDDDAIDGWYGVRDILAAHGAHITFFVTRWYSRPDQQRSELRALADAGHDVQPHSVNHLHARDYVQAHGLPAYLSDEMQPSIDGLVDAGYLPPTIYAYPFGETSDELNAAVLDVVPRVRVSPGSCPY